MRVTACNRVTPNDYRSLEVTRLGSDRVTRVTGPLGEDLVGLFDERAAILEYDGGYPRAQAEALARAEIEALHRRGEP
jgi:hypothetical protein